VTIKEIIWNYLSPGRLSASEIQALADHIESQLSEKHMRCTTCGFIVDTRYEVEFPGKRREEQTC
jgi:hypothetical protein